MEWIIGYTILEQLPSAFQAIQIDAVLEPLSFYLFVVSITTIAYMIGSWKAGAYPGGRRPGGPVGHKFWCSGVKLMNSPLHQYLVNLAPLKFLPWTPLHPLVLEWHPSHHVDWPFYISFLSLLSLLFSPLPFFPFPFLFHSFLGPLTPLMTWGRSPQTLKIRPCKDYICFCWSNYRVIVIHHVHVLVHLLLTHCKYKTGWKLQNRFMEICFALFWCTRFNITMYKYISYLLSQIYI